MPQDARPRCHFAYQSNCRHFLTKVKSRASLQASWRTPKCECTPKACPLMLLPQAPLWWLSHTLRIWPPAELHEQVMSAVRPRAFPNATCQVCGTCGQHRYWCDGGWLSWQKPIVQFCSFAWMQLLSSAREGPLVQSSLRQFVLCQGSLVTSNSELAHTGINRQKNSPLCSENGDNWFRDSQSMAEKVCFFF